MELSTERRERYRTLMADFLLSHQTGDVYNVEWNDHKGYLNSLIEDAIWCVRTETKLYGDDLLNGYPYTSSIEKFWVKVMAAINKKFASKESLEAYLKLEKAIEPLAKMGAAMMAMKPRIKNGKKPSTSPRKTPMRTYENTGTCGVCKMNVKIEGTGLYHHRFSVKYGQRLGKCFGTGYPPIEVSSNVLVDYLGIVLKPYKKGREMRLATLGMPELVEVVSHWRTVKVEGSRWPQPLKLKKGDTLYEMVRLEEVRHTESEIAQVAMTIEETEKQLKAWVPKPLPG